MSGSWTPERRARERELFAALATLDEHDARRIAIRDELVTMHMPLVHHLARRFADRGEPVEDLAQVGMIGLIKAVDRYDLARGVEFSSFATPTIVGEMKRHFRDYSWSVRVPRKLQEMQGQLTAGSAELSQRLGRAPTVAELAEHLGLSEDEVLDGLESGQAFHAASLDTPADEEGIALEARFGVDDEALDAVEYRESLKPLLAALSERDRAVVMMRFFGNSTQSQIAAELGISQMHVSRILAKSLASLRAGLMDEPA